MCQPPAWSSDDWKAPTEVAQASLDPCGFTGAPMLLHSFEYISRNVLKAWWGSMGPRESCQLP
jgi:hypothetical protein